MRDPPRPWLLATTPHDTKRGVKGGGRRTSGETSGRRSSGRACTRARGPREFARFSSALKKVVVCRRRRCAASSLADPDMEPITAFGGRPGKKMRAPVCVCHPKHNQAGPTRVRARYRRFCVLYPPPCARWPGPLGSWLAGHCHCPWVLVWTGACYWHGHPRARGGFSIITFVPRYLHGQNGVVTFRPTTRSRPRLGLVVRCGDLALQRKNMPFCTFFHVQPKYQNAPFSLISKVCGHV